MYNKQQGMSKNELSGWSLSSGQREKQMNFYADVMALTVDVKVGGYA